MKKINSLFLITFFLIILMTGCGENLNEKELSQIIKVLEKNKYISDNWIKEDKHNDGGISEIGTYHTSSFDYIYYVDGKYNVVSIVNPKDRDANTKSVIIVYIYYDVLIKSESERKKLCVGRNECEKYEFPHKIKKVVVKKSKKFMFFDKWGFTESSIKTPDYSIINSYVEGNINNDDIISIDIMGNDVIDIINTDSGKFYYLDLEVKAKAPGYASVTVKYNKDNHENSKTLYYYVNERLEIKECEYEDLFIKEDFN